MNETTETLARQLARLGVACNGKLPGGPEIARYVTERERIGREYPNMAWLIYRQAADLERKHYYTGRIG